ncbi:G-protein coupled receptor 3-like [Branchiostoma floridae x Branchiostoma belcheri]
MAYKELYISLTLLVFISTICYAGITTVSESGVNFTNGTGFSINDTDFSINDSGFSINDTDFSIKDTDFSINDSGFSINDTDLSIKDTDFSINDSGFSINDTDFSINDTDFSINDTDFSINDTGLSNSTLQNGSLGNCNTQTVFLISTDEEEENTTSNFSKQLQNDTVASTFPHRIEPMYVTLCLGVWSVVTNSLPLVAIIKYEHLHTPAYILMANLAASDVLAGIDFLCTGSSVLYYAYTETSASVAMSRVRFTLILLSGLSSAYSLMALTAERYWFIVHGMTYVNNVTNDKCKVVIMIVWAWSVLLAMLPHFGWICEGRAVEGCLTIGGGLPLSYVVFILVFVFIPMAAVVYFNLSIFWCLWKHVNAIADQEAAVGAQPSINRKSAITIIIITIVFLVGWLPFSVKMAMLTQDRVSLSKMFVFIILNSAINPLIYGLRLQEVRRGVARLFGCTNGNCNCNGNGNDNLGP